MTKPSPRLGFHYHHLVLLISGQRPSPLLFVVRGCALRAHVEHFGIRLCSQGEGVLSMLEASALRIFADDG